nr:SGNH/GDSL hydrolase family protein [Tardiphaga sp.]
MIDVINRGVGGEEAPEELQRLSQAAAEKPAMIIWQVGTNAIFHEENYAGGQVAAAIEKGLDAICTPDIDVLVMDLQYAPALLWPEKREATLAMVERIAEIVAARPDKNLQLFRRFSLMQYWHEIDGISFDRMTDPTDEARLHQSEWSTRAVSLELSHALTEAVK